jgi:hypothetical protein
MEGPSVPFETFWLQNKHNNLQKEKRKKENKEEGPQRA